MQYNLNTSAKQKTTKKNIAITMSAQLTNTGNRDNTTESVKRDMYIKFVNASKT